MGHCAHGLLTQACEAKTEIGEWPRSQLSALAAGIADPASSEGFEKLGLKTLPYSDCNHVTKTWNLAVIGILAGNGSATETGTWPEKLQ